MAHKHPAPVPDPPALSRGYGILFVTVIALIRVPALCMAVEDAKRLVRASQRRVSDS